MRSLAPLALAVLLVGGGCLSPDDTEAERPVAPQSEPVAPVPSAGFEEAYTRILQGRFEQAAAALERIRARPDQGGEYAAAVVFWLAYCAQEIGRPGEARDLYEWLVVSRPESEYAPIAAKIRQAMRPRPKR